MSDPSFQDFASPNFPKLQPPQHSAMLFNRGSAKHVVGFCEGSSFF